MGGEQAFGCWMEKWFCTAGIRRVWCLQEGGGVNLNPMAQDQWHLMAFVTMSHYNATLVTQLPNCRCDTHAGVILMHV